MIWLAVVFISYVVVASDECAGVRTGPVECYECSTYNNQPYCGDPFNATHPGLVAKMCDGVCLKWILKPKYGRMHLIRTCSLNVELHIPIAMVCMTESRPGNGKLCLCDKHRCNGSSAIHGASVVILLSMLTAAVLQGYFLTEWSEFSAGLPRSDDVTSLARDVTTSSQRRNSCLDHRKHSHISWTSTGVAS